MGSTANKLEENKRERLQELLDQILSVLSDFADAVTLPSRYPSLPERETVFTAAQYLAELGLTADAQRMRGSYDEILQAQMDVWLCDYAYGKTDELRDLLTETFGSFPQPISNAAQQAELQDTRRLAILGHVSQWKESLSGMRATMTPTLNRQTSDDEKLSYTQKELDAEIRSYKAKRANNYDDLVEQVGKGKTGAKKAARKMFGRNAVAKALRVRSPTMVSNSKVWKGIADELQLERKRQSDHESKVGLDMAVEQASQVEGDTTATDVEQREAIALIQRELPEELAVKVIDQLVRGELTVDSVHDLLRLCQEQKKDSNSRKVIDS